MIFLSKNKIFKTFLSTVLSDGDCYTGTGTSHGVLELVTRVWGMHNKFIHTCFGWATTELMEARCDYFSKQQSHDGLTKKRITRLWNISSDFRVHRLKWPYVGSFGDAIYVVIGRVSSGHILACIGRIKRSYSTAFQNSKTRHWCVRK